MEKKSENEMVLTEINLMDEGDSLFKLVGPIMAKQD
jgi:chaperonin cofactor prefoldin